jgi:hypothetical protein
MTIWTQLNLSLRATQRPAAIISMASSSMELTPRLGKPGVGGWVRWGAGGGGY